MGEGRKAKIMMPWQDASFEIIIQAKWSALDLLERISDKCNLSEKHYFGLAFKDEFNHMNWLQLDKRVLDYDMPKKDGLLILYFSIRFFIETYSRIKDVLALELFYLRAKELIFKDGMKCSDEDIFKLAALALREMVGAYVNDETTRKHISSKSLLPLYLLQKHPSISYCEDRIIYYYKTLINNSRGLVMVGFLSIVESQPSYGVHFFKVKDKSGLPWWLGLNVKGISVYDDDDRQIPRLTFQWKNIENIFYRDKKFCLEVHNPKRLSQTSINHGNVYDEAMQQRVDDDLVHAITDRTTQVSISSRRMQQPPHQQITHIDTTTTADLDVHSWICPTAPLTKSIWHMAVSQHQFSIEMSQLKFDESRTDEDLINELDSTTPIFSNVEWSSQSTTTALKCRMTGDDDGDDDDGGPLVDRKSFKGTPGEKLSRDMESINKARLQLEMLKSKKVGLDGKLKDMMKELKQLCLQEAELTGELSSDYPLDPGEPPPHVKRRVGTSYTLSPSVMNNVNLTEEMQSLLMQYELQDKITKAALNLTHDLSVGKNIRKKRLDNYQNELQKLKRLELTLKQKNSAKLNHQQHRYSCGNHLSTDDSPGIANNTKLHMMAESKPHKVQSKSLTFTPAHIRRSFEALTSPIVARVRTDRSPFVSRKHSSDDKVILHRTNSSTSQNKTFKIPCPPSSSSLTTPAAVQQQQQQLQQQQQHVADNANHNESDRYKSYKSAPSSPVPTRHHLVNDPTYNIEKQKIHAQLLQQQIQLQQMQQQQKTQQLQRQLEQQQPRQYIQNDANASQELFFRKGSYSSGSSQGGSSHYGGGCSGRRSKDLESVQSPTRTKAMVVNIERAKMQKIMKNNKMQQYYLQHDQQYFQQHYQQQQQQQKLQQRQQQKYNEPHHYQLNSPFHKYQDHDHRHLHPMSSSSSSTSCIFPVSADPRITSRNLAAGYGLLQCEEYTNWQLHQQQHYLHQQQKFSMPFINNTVANVDQQPQIYSFQNRTNNNLKIQPFSTSSNQELQTTSNNMTNEQQQQQQSNMNDYSYAMNNNITDHQFSRFYNLSANDFNRIKSESSSTLSSSSGGGASSSTTSSINQLYCRSNAYPSLSQLASMQHLSSNEQVHGSSDSSASGSSTFNNNDPSQFVERNQQQQQQFYPNNNNSNKFDRWSSSNQSSNSILSQQHQQHQNILSNDFNKQIDSNLFSKLTIIENNNNNNNNTDSTSINSRVTSINSDSGYEAPSIRGNKMITPPLSSSSSSLQSIQPSGSQPVQQQQQQQPSQQIQQSPNAKGLYKMETCKSFEMSDCYKYSEARRNHMLSQQQQQQQVQQQLLQQQQQRLLLLQTGSSNSNSSLSQSSLSSASSSSLTTPYSPDVGRHGNPFQHHFYNPNNAAGNKKDDTLTRSNVEDYHNTGKTYHLTNNNNIPNYRSSDNVSRSRKPILGGNEFPLNVDADVNSLYVGRNVASQMLVRQDEDPQQRSLSGSRETSFSSLQMNVKVAEEFNAEMLEWYELNGIPPQPDDRYTLV